MSYNLLTFNKNPLAEPLPVSLDLGNLQDQNMVEDQTSNLPDPSLTDASLPDPNLPDPTQQNVNNNQPTIIPDPNIPEPTQDDEIPKLNFFNISKENVGRIPRRIRKDFFSMYENADNKLNELYTGIKAGLDEKYNKKLEYELGAISSGNQTYEQLINAPGGKEVKDKIDKEFTDELNSLFKNQAGLIYEGLVKKQKDLFSSIPSSRKVTKTQARVAAALTNPGDNMAFSYFFDDDENYNNYSSIIQSFVKKGDISSPGYLDAVKKRDQYLEYWSNSAKPEYIERPTEQPVYINGTLHDKGAPTPEYAVRVENLKEGDNVRVPNGGAWLYWQDDNGDHHYKEVKPTGKKFYTDQPLATVAIDRLAPGEDKRGWDISQGIPDQRIPYLTVGKSGKYFANQFQIADLETQNTKGLSLYGVGENAFSYTKSRQEIDPKTGEPVIDPETNLPKLIKEDEEIVITGVVRSPKMIESDLNDIKDQLKNNPNDPELLRKKGVLERSLVKSKKVEVDRYKFAGNMTKALGEAVYGEKNWTKIKDQIRFEDALIENWDLYSRQGLFTALIGGKKSGKHGLTNLAYEYIGWLKKDDNWKNVNTFSAENLQKSLAEFAQTRAQNLKDDINQTKIDGIPFIAFASTAGSVKENVEQQLAKFNVTQTKIQSRIQSLYSAAKSGDKEALRTYTSLVNTYNNNVKTFNEKVVNNPNYTYYFEKMESPEYIENMAKIDELDFLNRENSQMLKKQALVTEDKAREAEGISIETGNFLTDGSARFATSFLNAGLSFVNSVIGLGGQAGSYIGGWVGLDGGARGSDYWAAATQTRDNEIDRYTRVQMLPETNSNGTFSFKNYTLNLFNMSGTAGFDLVSTLLAPEVRLIKGASAAAKYVNRFPGLFGVFTSGHFYDEWENAERAGMKGTSSILTHIVAKNLVQTALENLVNVKDVFPQMKVSTKELRSRFNNELNKVMTEVSGNVKFSDYGAAIYNTLKDLSPKVANFALKEFGLEENGQLFVEGLQNRVTNGIGNYNFDEDVFNIRSVIDNIGVGLTLGPLVLLGGSARAVGNRRSETVYSLVDEYGYDKVYNSLLDLRNSKANKVPGSEKIDEKFVNDMIKELPISLSLKKPESISDVKWLSIRSTLAKKESLLSQMKTSPESMRPVFQSQIDQLDANIGTIMSTSDEALSDAFRKDAVEIIKDENGVPIYSKLKQEQDATQESERLQQEGVPEGRIGEYAPAQQGEQIQVETTQPTADVGNINISGETQVAPVAPGKRLFNDPNPEAAIVEQQFKKEKGIVTPEPAKITAIDENRSKTIADAYEQMVDSPNDPQVQAAYKALADETMDQFDAISKSGVKVEVWTGEGEPYKNSGEMIADVRDNKHMYIFSTEAGFGDTKITDEQRQQNAMLRDSGFKDVNGRPLLVNDVFRFVHDYFGHTRLGNSFGAIGEENAWNVHARMYSPLARRAMTTETRGQNSWVNFNRSLRNPDGSMKKKGDEGYIPPAQRPFAEQKMGFLPEEFSNIEEAYSAAPEVTPATPVTPAAPAATPSVTPVEQVSAPVQEVTAPVQARPLTPEEDTRMSDARTMTREQFSAKYPDVSPEAFDLIKQSGFDNEQDFEAWQQDQAAKANQVASSIRDTIFTAKTDMQILSHALLNSWSKKIPGLSMVWDNYDENVEKAGFPTEYKEYAGFYDPNTKTVYINPDKMGLDTPIHEFGHVWYAVANMVDKNITKRGRDLIRGTEYEARVRAIDEYKDLEPEDIEEEALILAIGERGADIIDMARRNNFLTWLSDLFNFVAQKFGIDVNIENLNLGEFLDLAAMDILSGGEVLLSSSSDVEVEATGVKPSVVSAERFAIQSPQVKSRLDNAKRMESEGMTPDDIWEQTGMENIDGKWMTELDYNVKIIADINNVVDGMDRRGEPFAMLPLANVLSYPEFFKLYPDAKKLRVKVSRFNDTYLANFSQDMNLIRLNVDADKYAAVGGDYTSAMLHEIQHFIQSKDNLPRGTNIKAEFNNAKERLSGIFEKSGFSTAANTIRGLEYGQSYTGNELDLYNKTLAAAKFAYYTSKGEEQARNVEARFVDPTKREYRTVETQDIQRPKASVKSVMESKPYSKFMTEDADSYYFFHWSNEQRKVIDPNKFGNNRITSREERIARPSAAFFYTRPDFQEMGVGDYGHVVKILKDKVYPATADPLNFFDEAKALFEKSHPGMAFGPNQQIGWITKVANAKGYEMVVAKWGKQLRAETTNKVKPEWYQMPEGWGIKTNPKYAKLKKGFNETDGTGKLKAQTSPGIPLSFNVENRIPGMVDNIKRASINDFAGKDAVIISSDRLTTGLVDYEGFKSPHRKLGGIFYAAANKGYIWASSTANKAKSIINDIVYDEDGFGHIAIMAMSTDSHMSNYNSILFASDIIKTLKVPASVVADRVNKASRRATGDDIVSANDSLSKISDKINKYFSVESARFDARKPFLMSLLGNTKSGINEIGMPDFKSVSDKLSEPSLSGLRNGTVVAIMRFKGTPTVAETSVSKDGEAYHQSYPFAIKADGDVEVFLLDDAYEVEKVLPTFINRGGKTISFSDAEALYKDQAPARYTRNIFLSQPTAKLSISSRYGLDDGWSERAINEARTMLNNGMFQITENTGTGPVGFTLSVNGNTHGIYSSMQEAENQRDNIIKATIMKGYPQVSEMVAQNILFNAKRMNFTKPLNPSAVQGIVPSVNSRGYVGDTRTRSKKIKDATKAFFRKYFTFSKGLPKEIISLKESLGGKLSYQVSLAESMVNDMKKAAKKIDFKDWTTFDQALRDYRTYNPTNPFWVGGQPGYSPAANTNPSFFNLPVEMREFVVSMRALLDGISEQLVRNGLVSPETALTIESNMGKYVHRSYALFTMGDEWSKKVKDNKKIIDTAHQNLFQLYYVHLTNTNPGLTQAEIILQSNEEADKEINRILDSKKPFFGRDEASFLPYRNTGSLKQRQELPQWLRDLMGEYTDPGTAFLLSVGETATLLQTSDYLAKLRDFGLGTVFFEEGNAPADATYRIGSTSQALKPLEGLYTTKDMYDLLVETDNNRSSNFKWVWRLMNLNKMMKTVFSPVTQAKNFVSNTGFALHNGHFDVTALSDAWSYFRRQVINNKTQDVLEGLRPLFERGVLNQSLTAKELAEIFRTNDFEQYVLDNADKSGIQDYISDPGKLWRATTRGTSRVYQASDDFWKIYAYYNEQRSMSKVKYGKDYESLTQAEKDIVDNEAADRVMNTYPTYDRVLEIFKTVSKTGVLGNFVAFRAEVFRVMANTYAYAYNDIRNGIKEKNQRMVAYGTKRLLGIATYNAIRMEGIYLLAKYAGLGVSGLASSLWGGGDDEDKEKMAINSFVADWAKSDDKIYNASKIKDGIVEYYTFSSVDPYATIYNIFNAYKYGNEYDEKGGAIAAGLEVVAPFIEPEMTLRAFSSAIMNKDSYGFSIYNEDDSYFRKLFDGSLYVAKETLTPGVVTWFNRMFYRRDDQGKLQYGFNPSELYAAPIGARPYTINIGRKWTSELFNSNRSVFSDISTDFNRAAKNNESYEDKANERYNKEVLRLHKLYVDALTLGYPKDKLLEGLRSSRLDRRTMIAIVTGETFRAFDKDGKIGRRNAED
jgi:hypothetical protein